MQVPNTRDARARCGSRLRARLSLAFAIGLVGILGAGAPHAAAATVIGAVASTNVYADVLRQIGGSHVAVIGILSNPNTDPHSYESSTSDAAAVAAAALVVQNGLGYDEFMNKLEGASPNTRRVVIDVAAALGYRTGANPHLWYDPATMPKVAALVAAALSRQDPADRAAFAANLRAFDTSLQPWYAQIAAIKGRFGGAPIAVTEPVFGYLAAACGLRVLTPTSFQQAIMGGNDPSPQDVQLQKDLFTKHRIKLFVYNQQAVVPIAVQLLNLAHQHHIPVVGVYETRPLSKSYQQWMLAETGAVELALSKGVSTEQLH